MISSGKETAAPHISFYTSLPTTGSAGPEMAATMSGAWSYAVPLGEAEDNARPVVARRETLDSTSRQRDHSTGGMGVSSRNGAAPPLQKRSSAWDLQSDSEQAKQRRTSLRQSNTQATRKRSKNALRGKQEDGPVPRVDDSKWIHRDKLAQIEIKELQEAGYYVRPSRRSMSAGPGRDRSTSRSRGRRTSQEQQWQIDNDEDYAAAYPAHEESPRKMSTVLSADGDDEDGDDDDGQRAPVLQRPETYDPYRDSRFHPLDGASSEQQPSYRQHSGRPSTSRIPVSRASPAPVPQAVVDRDSPLPRSRAGSQTWNGSFDEMQYNRKTRNGSIGSQVLLEQSNDPQGNSDENSPPKARMPKKTTPNGRKPSTGNAPAMQRPGSSHLKQQATTAATAKRSPSSGHKSRPSTSHMHAPEGEAPWIASMYKPDPRLPPDQQMLPTHAKRMMQEQWEKDGNTGTAYDRDLRLLNNDEFQKPKPSVSPQEDPFPRSASSSPTKQKRPSPQRSQTGNSWEGKGDGARPPTSGGYRITPTIPDTPTMERFTPANLPPAPAPAPVLNPPAPTPDLSEKQEAKPKRGCCCVIM